MPQGKGLCHFDGSIYDFLLTRRAVSSIGGRLGLRSQPCGIFQSLYYCILRERSAICHQLVTALGLHQIGIRAKRSEYWEAMAARNACGHRGCRGGNYVTMEMFQELQEQIQQLAAAFEQGTGNRGNGRNRDPDHSREEEEALYQLSERK
ncbi:hypothetical protein CK203_041996 [Vitis vinifera]|uniref:Uncharacterized protein n=1 Tax=Vitis vinifera TaxID=29760 RepID=A0A438I0F5_VITVI|nr:hypothetical protein CK203_041996 [Vitis vinifera]